ncbi:phosphate ABC transporter substrate-binding protein PstS [Desulfosporosinus sp. BICA1-9]|uniref:phosphate ABC transporter substrate-binding protein PstS n=1 Tax=Desulfosporosinus sp. BICA1-9 TaxID=1531958 RepID=UPI00054C1E8E|nr:phosphate ABC transporter substrate-binding protein PstS [Desulfosporosinus sp. BICA1-9]KJS88472.1 MAG: phosphate ABC transporter substrate-binding protein [Desulfosporosinus sp. BICA1-9]
MFLTKRKVFTGIMAGVLALALAGCGAKAPAADTSKTPSEQPKAVVNEPSSKSVSLTGAGSSFVNPLMTQMVDKYHSKYSQLQVNYQSVGSGAGIKQISEQTIDFGATDGPMTDDQLSKAKGGKILQIPLSLGAVAVVYNLPNGPQELKMSSANLADIFLGKITKWNDPKIAADNSGVTLPDSAITVAHRSDGSGTSFIFTDYLSEVSADWKSKVGKGTSLNWPVGVGGKGNEGVAGVVKQTPGSIGYVELAYALQNKISYVTMMNKDGKWVLPSAKGASAAAAAAKIPDDMRVSIVNAPGADAYPIAGFVWGLVYQQQTDKDKGLGLVNFMEWAIHEGQDLGEPLHYAKLPDNLVTRIEAMLKSITFEGQALLK